VRPDGVKNNKEKVNAKPERALGKGLSDQAAGSGQLVSGTRNPLA
jgi:hypothetical protein